MKVIFGKYFSLLQKIGKSLMLPVSVLPVAGIMLGLGSAHFSFIPEVLNQFMAGSGDAIFSSIPLLFALSVALGFCNNDGVAALASLVGYMVMVTTMGIAGKLMGVEVKPILGMLSINTGVFGGIVIGGVSAYLFNRLYQVELPPYLGFFSGKRIVPIVTSFAAIFVGCLLAVVWPPIGTAISRFSIWTASSNPDFAFFIYGIGERLLVPFGLHHIWNVPFFFESGSFLDPQTGKTVTGEIARFLSGDPTAGNLAGGYLFKMWGLPAAALAMWHTARPENKKKTAGIMISAALTSFLTGITEPIEFAFLFIAPILYLVHALFSGLAFLLCILVGIKHGTTFSHGLIDFLVLFPKSTSAIWLWVLGPIWAAGYYSTFRFAIHFFNILTPGREKELVETDNSTVPNESLDKRPPTTSHAQLVLECLGGPANIGSLDACITRLRVELKDPTMANTDKLKSLGAHGVVQFGKGIQVIFGSKSESIKKQIESYLAKSSSNAGEVSDQKTVHSNSQISSHFPPKELFQFGSSSIEWVEIESAFGGSANIRFVDEISTNRKRIIVFDDSKINFEKLDVEITERISKVGPSRFHLIF